MGSLQKKMNSKIGYLYLVASENGLKGVFWEEQTVFVDEGASSEIAKILLKTEIQLSEYFDGKRKEFDLPLDVEGTDFQKKVWMQLSKIPYGKTYSYKEIAMKLKNEGASRAVGTANGKNPLSIIVPCHRVISSDGSLGGYAGGLDIKTKLLNLEKNGSL
jgi:methylated-DNA-[protein]-cysteine S-methyltransferase